MATMQIENRERFERLRTLSPVEAVQAWLAGEFGMGDEPAMIEAIRKDSRISLPDYLIEDWIFEAVDENWDVVRCIDVLAAVSAEFERGKS